MAITDMNCCTFVDNSASVVFDLKYFLTLVAVGQQSRS